jgi:hypothetical protein
MLADWNVIEMTLIRLLQMFTKKWPNYREQAAAGLLGAAVAYADRMGVDVEASLVRLRKNFGGKAAPYAPPRSS